MFKKLKIPANKQRHIETKLQDAIASLRIFLLKISLR